MGWAYAILVHISAILQTCESITDVWTEKREVADLQQLDFRNSLPDPDSDPCESKIICLFSYWDSKGIRSGSELRKYGCILLKVRNYSSPPFFSQPIAEVPYTEQSGSNIILADC